MKNILITGCAGFIGFHTSLKFIQNKNFRIYGIDNLNNYYDVKLKKERLKILRKNDNFIFHKIDLCNYQILIKKLKKIKFYNIFHLAAQAGVRYSINHPEEYVKSNLIAFHNILELSKNLKAEHLFFASTSSVYGNSKKFPLKENFNTDNPMTFYAATKKSNEVTAYSYSNIYNIPMTGLRFFTVYGPYGRPDMALFKFTKNIFKNKKIEIYNNGNHYRDFTYVEDVANILVKLSINLNKKTKKYRILNIASSKPIKLKKFLKTIEDFTNKRFKYNLLPLQIGDVRKTHADNKNLLNVIGKFNFTTIEVGIPLFIKWYIDFYIKKN